jgi:hypothetical protein
MNTRARVKAQGQVQDVSDRYQEAISSNYQKRRRFMSGAGGSGQNQNMPPNPPPQPPPNANQNMNLNQNLPPLPPSPPPNNPPPHQPLQLPYVPAYLQQALNGADPAHLRAINAYLRSQYASPPPRVPSLQTQITVINTSVEKPKHNPHTQTARAFIQDVVSYYAIQNIRENNYVLIFRSLLNEEGKSWYDNILPQIEDWEDLRDAFIQKYDTWYEKQERERALHNRRQGEKEKVAPYVWDMVRLSSMVYPNESEATTVQRCRQGLLPTIRLALGMPSYWCIDTLIQEAELVMSDLRDCEAEQGSSSSEGWNSPRNSNHRGDGSSRRSKGSQGYDQGDYNNQGSFEYEGSYTNEDGRHQVQEFRSYSNIQCYSCGEWGHYQSQCQTQFQQQLAYAATETPHQPEHRDEQPPRQFEENRDTDPSVVNTLNRKWEGPRSSHHTSQ